MAGPLRRLRAVARDVTALTGVPVDLGTELFLRARLAGFASSGRTSAGGSCRMLRAADGWVAVNLARPADHASVPALLNLLGGAGELTDAIAARPAAEAAGRAQLLGVPAAALGSECNRRPPVRRERLGPASEPRTPAGIRVVDFSALWAGPLCARLLGLGGAEVVKVESATRPDGARRGSPAFYRHLHRGHRGVVLDFTDPAALRSAVADADVVIEASRPRALRRAGLDAGWFLAGRPGRVWMSITGYGRADDRIAFGDDAAVAGGLVAWPPDGAGPAFLGDALADPVTGVYAARAAARSLRDGGGHLVDVAMAACAADVAGAGGGSPC
ncbi:CoA transferase [Streptomyces endophyticus]|uniref:CoA transferase n=1 Tax=Streptomyces endophyticus TaxID=714166 RepID=A0ABU6FC33_9ACTN|nr:CoA transferase [Streptomyces endophyticus]MEB8341404.1 CoA transferase [Streptomyces endophyticus]